MKTLVDIPNSLLDTQAPIDAETQVILMLLRAWLSRPESRQLVRAAADMIQDELALQLYSDTIRLPESASERRNGFTRWVKLQLEALDSWIEERVEETMVSLRPSLPLEGKVQHIAEELISAQLRRETRRRLRKTLAAYAVRACAHRWTSLNLGETFLPGEPQHRSGIWLVPIFHRQRNSWLTTLRLSATGESLSDPKALQDEIEVHLGRLRPASPVGTACSQL
jgi:hypothetical protein